MNASIQWRDRPGIKTPSEADIHKAVASYLVWALPPSVMWTTFPAGGGGKVRGAKLQAAGLRAGWPDLQFVHPSSGILYTIELKAQRKYPEPIQRAVMDALCASHAPAAVARSPEEVEGLLRGWGFPLKASVGRIAA